MHIAESKYKIVMLGEFAVGKTSLVKRFVYDIFDDHYLTTIGVKVSKKELSMGDGKVTMLIWDIGQLSDAVYATPQYMQGAKGAIIVGDVTRIDSMARIDHHVGAFRAVSPEGRVVIAVNKYDLCPVSGPSDGAECMIESCRSRYGDGVFYTSARTGENVEALFLALARRLMG